MGDNDSVSAIPTAGRGRGPRCEAGENRTPVGRSSGDERER
jgi:hypothetical protein